MSQVFKQEAFNQWIIQHDVIGFQENPITLKSGKQSYWYVNWRRATSDALLCQQVAEFVVQFIQAQSLEPDSILGVPEGATKLGIICQMQWAQAQSNFTAGSHVLAMLRKSPKKHGAAEDRYFIGEPKGRVILLEDVTTSGGSLVETLVQLQQLKVDVVACVSLSDRMTKRDDGLTVKQLLATYNTPYFAMSDAKQLLSAAYKNNKPDADILKHICQEVGFNISDS